MRYDQSMRALKTLLDRGELGTPVVAEIVMNARPHWQEFIKPYGRIALLNMSIHDLDVFRFLFGDPERIPSRRGPTRATTSRTRTGWPSTPRVRDGLRAIGLATASLGSTTASTGGSKAPRASRREPSAGRTTEGPSTIDWTTRELEGMWEQLRGRALVPAGLKGTMGQPMRASEDVPAGIRPNDSRHDGPVEAAYRSVREGRAGPARGDARGGGDRLRTTVPPRRTGRLCDRRGRRPRRGICTSLAAPARSGRVRRRRRGPRRGHRPSCRDRAASLAARGRRHGPGRSGGGRREDDPRLGASTCSSTTPRSTRDGRGRRSPRTNGITCWRPNRRRTSCARAPAMPR